MTEIGKIAAAAIVAALCAVTIRKQTPEVGMLLTLAGGVMILLFCADALSDVLSVLRDIGNRSGLSDELVEPVIKIIGISLVTRITAEVCKDAKEGGLASVVEAAGTVLALTAMLPLMLAVLSLLSQLL